MTDYNLTGQYFFGKLPLSNGKIAFLIWLFLHFKKKAVCFSTKLNQPFLLQTDIFHMHQFRKLLYPFVDFCG